ncbi:MAG: PQQ-like beta-propeller repeat protein [Bifidobacteriaceae bacterium]|nr:PQQ-like beta-propeller repeat protein [Bifidobacteriaceae bacterium]
MRSRGLEAGAGGASGLQEQTGGAAGESAAGGATPAPDIAVAPVLGPAISTGALLGDGFERSTFEGFLGQATGLASGSNTPQAEAREGGDAAAGAGPLLELVGFDLDSGEAKWRLDPMAQFGLDPGVGVDRQFTFSDELGAMVLDQSGYAPDAPDAVLAVLDDTGEVVSETRIAPVERVIGFHGGTLVVGGEGRIAGYTATALGQPTWEAAYPGFERELFNPRTGTWLIFGAGGFIDALTGETLASGADIASAMYYLAEGDSDVLLRHDSETLEVTRVDLRTGAAVWDHGVEATQIVAVALVSGGVLMFDVLELGTGRGQVVGVDADSGEELWSQPGYGLRVLTGAGALTVASDFTDLAVRDLRTGAVLSQRALGEEERLMCAGWDIAYLADTGNQVTGLDLADGLADLWTVDLAGQLPTAEPGPIIPLATGGRLFAARLAEMDWLLGGSAATPESFLVELKGGA